MERVAARLPPLCIERDQDQDHPPRAPLDHDQQGKVPNQFFSLCCNHPLLGRVAKNTNKKQSRQTHEKEVFMDYSVLFKCLIKVFFEVIGIDFDVPDA